MINARLTNELINRLTNKQKAQALPAEKHISICVYQYSM